MARRAVPVLLLALAGCVPVPQPFQHDGPNPLLDVTPMRPISIGAIDGAPAPDRLARALAAALHELEILAVDKDVPTAFKMTGTAQDDDDSGTVRLTLRLTEPEGRNLGEVVESLPARDWASARPGALRDLAARAAPSIARLLRGDDDAGQTPAGAKPVLSVRPIPSAPGDGATTLPKAMTEALLAAGLVIGDGPEAYAVSCLVTVTPLSPHEEMVSIAWTVSAPDGKELGTVSQGGPMPAGTMGKAWGRTAHMIAAGGVDGVLQILDSTRRAK